MKESFPPAKKASPNVGDSNKGWEDDKVLNMYLHYHVTKKLSYSVY